MFLTSASGLFCCALRHPKGTGTAAEREVHWGRCGFPRSAKKLKWEVPKKMANDARVKITLVCTECKQRNYDTKKNKKNDPDRMEFNKFCRFCKKHTLHRESK